MGLLNLLSAAKPQPLARPVYRDLAPLSAALGVDEPLVYETLRLLFEAAAAEDDVRTRRLLHDHGPFLRSHAAKWMRPPAALAGNPIALKWRQEGVQRLIWRCADQFGQASWLGEWERLRDNER
jgi:hypothetical protein